MINQPNCHYKQTPVVCIQLIATNKFLSMKQRQIETHTTNLNTFQSKKHLQSASLFSCSLLRLCSRVK